MIEGKSVFRIYHELDLEIDVLRIRLIELKKELDALICHESPKRYKSQSFDGLGVVSALASNPEEYAYETARITYQIGDCTDRLAIKQDAFDDLKKRIRQTKNKLESDTTLNVFVVRVIEGKSPEETARLLGYERPTIFNAMTEINRHMGVTL